jgi:hypothetical protein
MRVIARDPPLCSRRELLDGTYTINHLADFWELMDEEAEYHRRYRVEMERQRKAKEKH